MKSEIMIIVKDQTGVSHVLKCPLDMALNVKDMCKAYELPMEAVCGGMASCATCHCYVTSDLSVLPVKGDVEEALLSELFNTKENSRLACQIPLTEKLDCLSIELPTDS